jgi:hypothetical protein
MGLRNLLSAALIPSIGFQPSGGNIVTMKTIYHKVLW